MWEKLKIEKSYFEKNNTSFTWGVGWYHTTELKVQENLKSRNLNVDVCGSVHHTTIHKEKSNKMQQCIKIVLFHIYMKLNMFRATHRPSSGA
jgi:hypothetical protein